MTFSRCVRWWIILTNDLGNNKSNSYSTIRWKRPYSLHFCRCSIADVTAPFLVHMKGLAELRAMISIRSQAATHVSDNSWQLQSDIKGTIHSLTGYILICNTSKPVRTMIIWTLKKKKVLFDGYPLWQNPGNQIGTESPALEKWVAVAKEP